jgi:hypothetical protein
MALTCSQPVFSPRLGFQCARSWPNIWEPLDQSPVLIWPNLYCFTHFLSFYYLSNWLLKREIETVLDNFPVQTKCCVCDYWRQFAAKCWSSKSQTGRKPQPLSPKHGYHLIMQAETYCKIQIHVLSLHHVYNTEEFTLCDCELVQRNFCPQNLGLALY